MGCRLSSSQPHKHDSGAAANLSPKGTKFEWPGGSPGPVNVEIVDYH